MHTHSQLTHTHSHPDTLRQELMRLSLDTREVRTWLGVKFDGGDFRFHHDIPLQRTISLDRGIDIFNYLQTLSDYKSSESFWSLGSEVAGSSLRLECYRSFEDIPAPFRVRGRLSLDDGSVYGCITPPVLKDTYKGIDESGILTPQIRKLQKTYSFKNFDDTRDSSEDLEKVDPRPKSGIEFRVPVFRRNLEMKDKCDDRSDKSSRQRRPGVTQNQFQYNPIQNLRKEVLHLAHFKSCDSVFTNIHASGSGSSYTDTKKLKSSHNALDARKLRRNVSLRFDLNEEYGSEATVTSDSYYNVASVEKTPISVDGRNCDCSICREGEVKTSFMVGNFLYKIFIKLITYRYYGKKYNYTDGNRESEMYNNVLSVLKFLIGIWLRHLDHKQANMQCV